MELLKHMGADLLQTIIPLIVIPAILRFLPKILPVTGHIFEWIKGRAGTVSNQYAASILSRLTDLVWAKVHAFENTVIEDLKAALADGKVTKDELKGLLFKVKEDALGQVKTEANAQRLWQMALYVFGGDEKALESWLANELESHVAGLPPSGLQTSKDGTTPAIVDLVAVKQAA